jgi:soluble P-type ATPase
MVGDGWSDYLTRLEHACDLFVAFTENVERPAVVAGADVVVKDFGKVIRLCSDEKVLIPKGTN